MTDQTITIEQIQATKTYQSLNSIQQSFIIKRGNRELLSHALVVYKNTTVIPGNVAGYNLSILGEFIELEKANALGELIKNSTSVTVKEVVFEDNPLFSTRYTYVDDKLISTEHFHIGKGNKIENLEWINKPKNE